MGIIKSSHRELGRPTLVALVSGIALWALFACSSDDETSSNQPSGAGSGGATSNATSSVQGGTTAESSTLGSGTGVGGQSAESSTSSAATSAPGSETGGSSASGGTSAANGGNSAQSSSHSSASGGTISITSATTGTGTATVSDPAKPKTNLPSAAHTEVKRTAVAEGLQLVNINLVPESESTLNYIELFGEIRNSGATLVCFPQLTFEFVNAAGTVLWSDTAYADASPYVSSSSTVSMACLKPGESGAIWANDLPAAAISVASVAEFTATLNGLDTTATPFLHTLTVSIVEDAIYVDNNHWAMSGSFKPSQAVRNIGITGYTKSSAGLLTGRLTATNLGSIAANTAWPFATDLGIVGPRPASILAYAEFILGTTLEATAGAMSPLTTDPLLDPIALERRESRRQAEARKALADELRR